LRERRYAGKSCAGLEAPFPRLSKKLKLLQGLKGAKGLIEHRQTAIYDPSSNQAIEVDEGIAPLLKAIWDLGITTCNSCQENKPDIVWIEFISTEDVEAFLTRIISGLDPVNSPDANDWLYSRIMGANDGWQYTAHPHDAREYMDEKKGTLGLNASEQCKIALSISIRFPVGDYEILLDLVGR